MIYCRNWRGPLHWHVCFLHVLISGPSTLLYPPPCPQYSYMFPVTSSYFQVDFCLLVSTHDREDEILGFLGPGWFYLTYCPLLLLCYNWQDSYASLWLNNIHWLHRSYFIYSFIYWHTCKLIPYLSYCGQCHSKHRHAGISLLSAKLISFGSVPRNEIAGSHGGFNSRF